MTEKFNEKFEAAPASDGADSALDALAPTASRCTQKIAESDAAMVQGEWIAETGEQVSRQVSRQISRRDVETASQEYSDSTDDDDDFPDGGLEAWLVVLGAWCVSFCSYGWINSKFPITLLSNLFL